MARSLCLVLMLAGTALGAPAAFAATLEPVGTFDQPIFVTSDPDHPDRLLVVERDGRVAEVDGDGAAPQLHADLTGLVACCSSERGLLSIAPAPDFHQSGLFYAAYTGKPAAGGAEGDIHVDAFIAGQDGAISARMPIISIPHSQAANHNGGQIQFGPDGYLYISTGDGGGGGDPFETGQDLDSLLGKILRIEPRPGLAPPYAIPAGNPFAGPTAGRDEIWAYGLRNPWRFSFDSFTGGLVIGDVGQGAHEEVDWAPSPGFGLATAAGLNYGWSCREGFSAYTDSTPSANCVGASGFTDPVFDYPHEDPEDGSAHGCSITGGYVVRDPTLTGLEGRYLYADYCTSEIRSLALPAAGGRVTDDASAGIATPTPNPVSFGEDSCRRLYVVAGSEVLRFEGAVPADCPEAPEEEPPGEDEAAPPPKGEPPAQVLPGSDPPGQASRAPDPPATGHRVTIAPDGKYRRFFKVIVRIRPCRTNADYEFSVQLNRGGRRVGRDDDLSRGCGASF
jgi:hypothetical protein